MNYIVFDLEWNQSEEKKKQNKDLLFEIIEIGAIKLDECKNLIGEFSQIIKPRVYSDINHITKDLIQLKMEELERGLPFNDVINSFLEWCGDDYIFCTWGSLDLIELQRNMKFYNMKSLADKPIAYLDAQKLFSRQFEDKESRRTLEYAVDFLSIKKDIPFHRAFADAYYTAKVMMKILKETEKHISFDVFHLPKDKKSEVHIAFNDYFKYISREFPSKTLAMSDKVVVSTHCYKCGQFLRKKIKWFTSNGKHYYSVSYCPKHGYMKGKIRIRKTDTDTVYVVKTLKLISDEQMQEIIRKRDKARQQKVHRRRQQNKHMNGKNEEASS